jgi:hypothetical protein
MVDVRHHRNGSVVAGGSTAPFYDNNAEERQDTLRETTEPLLSDLEGQALQPHLSWTMTLLLLVAVTTVSFSQLHPWLR